MNKYKILSCIFIILILGLSINLYYQNKEYDFKSFKIKEKQLNDIAEVIENDFIICEIRTNECMKINKRG